MKILHENKEVQIDMNNLRQQILGYVKKFREDYAKGLVNLQAPKKK